MCNSKGHHHEPKQQEKREFTIKWPGIFVFDQFPNLYAN